jgi:hypothetical protein
MTDELTTMLAKNSTLRIVSRTSAALLTLTLSSKARSRDQ